eukprot:TRINITY_DN23580_c0_g1_i1.p1 TRINITY_DN23580_c0_g1~~TRINITY_DN23580_c0_g1_i1.p1  ORF type:complete len:297 (+),score=41.45 TRINITY_DN23580_c0_g1_i1:65-955(+)
MAKSRGIDVDVAIPTLTHHCGDLEQQRMERIRVAESRLARAAVKRAAIDSCITELQTRHDAESAEEATNTRREEQKIRELSRRALTLLEENIRSTRERRLAIEEETRALLRETGMLAENEDRCRGVLRQSVAAEDIRISQELSSAENRVVYVTSGSHGDVKHALGALREETDRVCALEDVDGWQASISGAKTVRTDAACRPLPRQEPLPFGWHVENPFDGVGSAYGKRRCTADAPRRFKDETVRVLSTKGETHSDLVRGLVTPRMLAAGPKPPPCGGRHRPRSVAAPRAWGNVVGS